MRTTPFRSRRACPERSRADDQHRHAERTRGWTVAADGQHRFEAHGLLVFIFVEPREPPRSFPGYARPCSSGADLVGLSSSHDHSASRAAPGTAFDQCLENHATLLSTRRQRWTSQCHRGKVTASGQAGPTDHRLCGPPSWTSRSTLVQRVPRHPSLASRLRHLFVEQTGLAFKTYLLWLRLGARGPGRCGRSVAHRAPPTKPASPIPPTSAAPSGACSASPATDA